MAELNIVIRARNMMAAGLAAAGQSVRTFGKTLQGVWRASMGPIAVIIAAVMALKKVFEWASEAAGRYGKMIRTIQGDNEAAAIKRLSDAVRKLTQVYVEANAAADRQAAISKARTAAFDAEEKATRALAKARAIAALDPADKEGREKIERDFAEGEAATAGQNKAADLLTDQLREQEKAARAVALVAELRNKSESAYGRLVKANVDVENARQASMKNFLGMTTKGRADSRNEELEKAQQRQKDAMEAFKTVDAEIKKAQTQIETATAAAAAKGMEANAAQMEEAARALDAQNALEAEAAAEALARQKQTDNERAKLQKQAGDLRIKLAEEQAKRQADAEVEALQAEADAIKEKIKAAEDVAKLTVDQFIEKEKAGKTEEQRMKDEAKRRSDIDKKLARGTKLSKEDQEFVKAQDAIEAAKREADRQAAELEEKERLIKEARDKDSANFVNMKDSLANIEKTIDDVLRAK